MADLTQEKLAAEIELIRAQAKKAAADAQSGGAFFKLSEGIKLVGAVILGLGGLTAAVTGYQSTELKKQQMEVAMTLQQVEMQKNQLELQKLTDLLARKQEDYATALADLEKVQAQLSRLKTEVAAVPAVPRDTRETLDRTIGTANQAKAQMERHKAEFDALKTQLDLDAYRMSQQRLRKALPAAPQ